MRVLVAPQEFKGSLTAVEAAAAIARGLRRARPAWDLDILPLADGGPGFLDAMHGASGGELREVVVHDALGRPVAARYLWQPGPRRAIVEAAEANGLLRIAPAERDALAAGTYGVGELLRAAVEAGPAELLVGVGGSATTDGGAGMACALGARFLDRDGRELGPGGGALIALDRIEWTPPAWCSRTRVVVATDVTSPLAGPTGAAHIFAPQKGASPEDVALLDAALARFAAVVARDIGVDVADPPGSGAAGGLAAGLVAFAGASIVSGFDVVADATRLRDRLGRADLVVTGEGSFDRQSRQGKTTGRVLALSREHGSRAVVLAGRSDEPSSPFVRTLAELEPVAVRSMTNAAELLEQLAARWAAAWDEAPS